MTITLDVRIFGGITDHQLYEFCRQHADLRIERTSRGELVILPPTGGCSGNQNFSLGGRFARWVDAHPELGLGFDSSSGFILPNGAMRAPDLAWVRRERWEGLTPEQQEKFPPLCPDFVVELISRTDELSEQRAKLEEYIANGARLGWLIDPLRGQVEIYRPGQPVEICERPATLSGEGVLPGLELSLAGIIV